MEPYIKRKKGRKLENPNKQFKYKTNLITKINKEVSMAERRRAAARSSEARSRSRRAAAKRSSARRR